MLLVETELCISITVKKPLQRLLLKQQIKLLKPAVYIRHKDPHEEKNFYLYQSMIFVIKKLI